QDATMKEIMSPDYNRVRGGLINLAENAEGQDFPAPGLFLRKALPDRVDAIENIVAEGDRVAMLWRLNATHTGNLFGIPPTGKKIDIYEVGFFRVVDEKIVEGWFMCDELGLLIQLGAQMPKRKDGRRIAPHVTDEGEDGDALVERLTAGSPSTQQDRNKLKVARSKSSYKKPEDRGDYNQARWGLQHLRDYGEKNGVMQFDPSHAFPGRNDRITGLIAEGDEVWMRFNLRGTNSQSFYGLAPTGKRCEMNEVGISRFVGDQWKEGWYLADGLGILLQLDALSLLEKLGCKPV
ncbi:MAG TPA: ester cyclase, partial [Burkholderiales bacterium]|nr:ester cyclase [Burkholderiales bacterium]